MQVAHMVGQQQNKFGIDQGALLIGQITVGVDQSFVKIVTGCEVTKVTLAWLVEIGLELKLVLNLAHGAFTIGKLAHIAFFQSQTAMAACCKAACTFCASN